VSAHWEERIPTVMTSARPPMLYDYFGFPPESYRITWPAPGEPALAARVRALLGAAGIDSAEDPARGYDHGAFVPLKVTYPEANIPTIQLSLQKGLDPATHLAIGRALAPLRDEGVFVVGSGMSFHNMRAFFSNAGPRASEAFDAWLGEAVTAAPEERDRRLLQWAEAPSGRECHPREEHLLPLMVIAGAAGASRGEVAFRGDRPAGAIAREHPLAQAAAAAYRDALRARPGDADAAWNYELALRRLEQQKQQQKQQQEGGNPPPPKKDDFEKKAKMSRDKAEQLLQAIARNDLEEQRKKVAEQKKQRRSGRDW